MDGERRWKRVVMQTGLAATCCGAGLAAAAPVPGPLVELVQAQEPGTWLQVSQNQFRDVWTPPAQTAGPGGSNARYVISAWSAGSYDPRTGDFYVWGGDNGTYSGNEMYRWTARSLRWERLSLPSANTSTTLPSGRIHWHTVDGSPHSPISGETFDAAVYLRGVDRVAVIGGNAYPGGGRQYFLEDGVTRAGPFFFDPARGDPDKVGGLTGSQAHPDLFPDVLGGGMWQNRQSIQAPGGAVVGPITPRVTAATQLGGVDVVYVGEAGIGKQGRLFRYTVNGLDPTLDQWEVVGIMGSKTFTGDGAGAYDPDRNLFVRTGKTKHRFLDEATGAYVNRLVDSLMFWDLNRAGGSNLVHYIHPESLLGDALPLTGKMGIDYDPLTQAFYLWSGLGDVWRLLPPDQPGTTGWTVRHLDPGGLLPGLDGSQFTGVFGKWNYMEDLGAFMGVAHDTRGDVWIYKPPAIGSEAARAAQATPAGGLGPMLPPPGAAVLPGPSGWPLATLLLASAALASRGARRPGT